jgi:tetratricopeptide (TPR) repeat protein
MNLFSRLFGKKAKNQETPAPEPKQEKATQPDPPANEPTKEPELPPEPKPESKQQPTASATKSKPTTPKPKKPKTAADAPLVKETIPWRTFSIFISSTFADMQAERDHLKNVVFSQVEEELQKRRIKLEIVDLRWGVDTAGIQQENEREANVLKVCLDEIKRCRPFFIGLLGDRYGWVPPEKRMADAVVGEGLKVSLKDKSVTDLEIEFGVLASREQLVRSAFYFREPLPYDEFPAQRAKLYSDQHSPDLSPEEKTVRKVALDELKAKIRKHFELVKQSEKVKTYTAAWDAEKEKVTELEAFGEMVKADILSECESHAAETWDDMPQNWQEQELALLDAFINHHTHITTFIGEKGEEHVPTFCGRKPLLEELKQHLLSADAENWGLVLTGESGSGKSAVFSMVHKMMEKGDCFILAHSAGLSPKAKHVANLLKIWNNLLRKELGMKQVMEEDTSPPAFLLNERREREGIGSKAPETPIEQLQQQFAELLSMTAKNKRVVLLIDALDRFEPTGRAQAMSWLPALMPRNARLLCTAITGTEERAVKYHRGLQSRSIDLFTPEEAKEMLSALGRRNHKTLPAGIAKLILDKKTNNGLPAASNPLWLSLAVNILMAIDQDDFEEMSKLEGRGDQQIESYLTNMAKGFDPLPGKLFLSLVEKACVLFGRAFTTAVFDNIAISRNGLREKDLEALLTAEGIAWDPLRYAMLRRWFKSHLVMQGEELQWNLAHSILDNTLLHNLEEGERKAKHQAVGSYLLTLPENDALKISETMYHLLESDNLAGAAAYYGRELTTDQISGATTVLAEWITLKENGLTAAFELPILVVKQDDRFHNLLERYIYDLNDALALEGNLSARLEVLEGLERCTLQYEGSLVQSAVFGYDKAVLFEKLGSIHQAMGHMEESLKYFEQRSILGKELYESNPRNESLKNGLAISYSKLGSIHQAMGHMEEALKYFEQDIELTKELYESNPRNESLKNGLAISYEKLGSIHQAMGHMEEALKYFDDYNRLSKELYESNPQNIGLLEGLGISYYKLAMIHKSLGHDQKGQAYFAQWKQIISFLIKNVPQVSKYHQWNQLKY